jgi:putative membrane protein
MTIRSSRHALGGAAILLLASCGGPRPAPPPRPITILPSTAAALTPAVYMQLAASSSLFAIRASELASQQARDGALRDAARSVIRDQGGVASQLSFAGRRLDLLPSAELDPAQAADLDRLRTSSDFDREYRQLVGNALARALEAHETFARAGSSPTLRPVATMAAPVTRRNLGAVRSR